jgi:hypothetical protein
MLSVLALSLLLPATTPAAPAARPDDPPIRLRLSEDVYARGDHAKVRVKAAEDGYLLVLQANADGRIRVLYPLDPDDSARVRGGRQFEIRGRGDRDAFVVTEREGAGTVLAAWSEQPFRFDEFTRNGHWDYRALAAEPSGADRQSELLDLVDRMSTGHYEYDTADYTVTGRSYARYDGGWYTPWYHGYYYPWYPWGWRGYYGPRFGFGWRGWYWW